MHFNGDLLCQVSRFSIETHITQSLCRPLGSYFGFTFIYSIKTTIKNSSDMVIFLCQSSLTFVVHDILGEQNSMQMRQFYKIWVYNDRGNILRNNKHLNC
jgi:hypothetical protein